MALGSFAIVGTLLRRRDFSAPLDIAFPGANEAVISELVNGPGIFSREGRLGQFAELWALARSDYEAQVGAIDWQRVRVGHAQIRVEVAQVLGCSQEDRETAVVHVDNYYAGHLSYLAADAFPPTFPSFGKVGTRRVDDFLAATLSFLSAPVQLQPYAVARYDASVLHAGPMLCLGNNFGRQPARPWRTRVRLSFHEPWKVATQLLSKVIGGGSRWPATEQADQALPETPRTDLEISWRASSGDAGKLCNFAIGGPLRRVEVAKHIRDARSCEGSLLQLVVSAHVVLQPTPSIGIEVANFAQMTEPSVLAVSDRKAQKVAGTLEKAEEQSQALVGSELELTWANSSMRETLQRPPVSRHTHILGVAVKPCTLHNGRATSGRPGSTRGCSADGICRLWCEFEFGASVAEPLSLHTCLELVATASSNLSSKSHSAGCHASSQLLAAWIAPSPAGLLANVHVFGYDIADHNLAGIDQASQTTNCSTLCESRPDCTHWMLVPGDYSGLPAPTVLPVPAIVAMRGTCLLKTRDARQMAHQGLISGTRGCAADALCAEHDVEYWGGLYRDQKSPTADICQKLCQANSYCAYWTYVPLEYVAPPPGHLEHVPEIVTSFLRGRCFLKYPPSTLPISYVSEFSGAIAGYGHKLRDAKAPVPAFDPVWLLSHFSVPAGRETLLQGAPLVLRPHADSASYISFLDERLCLQVDSHVYPLRIAFFVSPLGGDDAQRLQIRVVLFQPLEAVGQFGHGDALVARVHRRTGDLQCQLLEAYGSRVCVLDISSIGTIEPNADDSIGPFCFGWQVGSTPAPLAFSGPRLGSEAADALPVWWVRGELEEGEVRIFLDRQLRTYSMQLQYQL